MVDQKRETKHGGCIGFTDPKTRKRLRTCAPDQPVLTALSKIGESCGQALCDPCLDAAVKSKKYYEPIGGTRWT